MPCGDLILFVSAFRKDGVEDLFGAEEFVDVGFSVVLDVVAELGGRYSLTEKVRLVRASSRLGGCLRHFSLRLASEDLNISL